MHTRVSNYDLAQLYLGKEIQTLGTVMYSDRLGMHPISLIVPGVPIGEVESVSFLIPGKDMLKVKYGWVYAKQVMFSSMEKYESKSYFFQVIGAITIAKLLKLI